MFPEIGQDSQEIQEALLEFIQTQKNVTGNQLILHIREKYSLDNAAILEILQNFYQPEEIERNLPVRVETAPSTPKEESFPSIRYNLWLCFILVLVSFTFALFVPENALESGNGLIIGLGTIRLILGTLFVFFLPGYTLYATFWPNKEEAELDQFGISFGLSVGVVSILGLGLNFTFLGLSQMSLFTVLTSFTLVFLMVAIFRNYQEIIQFETEPLEESRRKEVPEVPVEAEPPIESELPEVPVEAEAPIDYEVPEAPVEAEVSIASEKPRIPVEVASPTESEAPDVPVETEASIESEKPEIPVEVASPTEPAAPGVPLKVKLPTGLDTPIELDVLKDTLGDELELKPAVLHKKSLLKLVIPRNKFNYNTKLTPDITKDHEQEVKL